ncbi:MAG: hypothetical protein HKN79_03745, partial [Flavobacteriales bacterium]|nr:hypothetical protein [Flavobacteriales bacterium]
MATIKNFDLQAIRARYLASKHNKNARTGSVERRAPAIGGIVGFSLDKGKIQSQETFAELREPRGIAQHGNTLAISSENLVYLMNSEGLRSLDDKWFSYIHTVDFSKDGSRLLVSSSGFDVILEYDVSTLERSAEWWAWENGFDQGIDPETGDKITLSRSPIEGKDRVRVIADPSIDSLPTAMRAAFINSVEYDRTDEKHYIATFFHEGAVFSIDTHTGEAEPLISGMKNPHGGMLDSHGAMATSTRTGEVILMKRDEEISYSFCDLPHKPPTLGNEEWLQNSKRLPDGSILTIDSNRTSWVIF